MGIYVHARVKDSEGVLIPATFDVFKGNLLIGKYSEDDPYFKMTKPIKNVFERLGYKLSDYFNEKLHGKVFAPSEIIELYSKLHREKEALRQWFAVMPEAAAKEYVEKYFAPEETVNALLHFFGLCLAHQYAVSLS